MIRLAESCDDLCVVVLYRLEGRFRDYVGI